MGAGTWALALAWAMGLAAGAPPAVAAQPYSVRDDLQREVRFEAPPRRIVSLLPSLTETVCALQECERLVGTDRYSNWPAQVADLPKMGGLDDAQVELIAALRPDVVLLSRSARVTERLAQLGIPTFAVETNTYPGIARTIQRLAEVLGVPDRASALTRQLQEEVDTVARASNRRRAARPAPSVYFEVDAASVAAGEASFIGELLSMLGARNIASAALGPFPRLNPEFVVQRNPDVIFVSPQQAATLAGRPGWDRVRAVREQRLCSFSPQVRDTIVRPGPRVAEGMRALADCLDKVAP